VISEEATPPSENLGVKSRFLPQKALELEVNSKDTVELSRTLAMNQDRGAFGKPNIHTLASTKTKKGVDGDALALPLFSRIVQVGLKVATMSPGAG
jgi:hypothetical protein